MILLVMQTLDNSMRLKAKRRWPNGNVVLTTEQDPGTPIPTRSPPLTGWPSGWRRGLGGAPQAMFTEAMFSIPTTAHILGGAVIGERPQTGVVDDEHRVFG